MKKGKVVKRDGAADYEEYIVDVNGDGIPDVVRVYNRKGWYNNVRVANVWFGSYLKKRRREKPGSRVRRPVE